MLNCIIRKRNYLLLIPTFDQTLCVLFQYHFRLGLTKVFVWLYTGHVICGNETQGLLLCSLPFAACYSPGTKPPCFTESRRCTGKDIKQRKLLFLKLMMLAVCRLSCFSAPLLSNMAVFYHVNDYNQAQKSLTHLSKTGAFIHNFIHILFHSVLRRKSPLPRINVVCGKRQT